MAKEPFFKINIRKSASKTDAAWDAYTKTYGDWMANAFQDQKKVKEQFLSALDSLHKNYPKAAVQTLDSELKAYCKTDEEKTVWLFFMGIAHKNMEQYANALLYFTSAAEDETESPEIYQHLADCAYREGLFGFAECNYLEALRLYEQNEETSSHTLAVVYAALASCLIMMHDYNAAQEALESSEKKESKLPEALKAKVLLHAVRGEFEKAEASLKTLLKQKGVQEDSTLRHQIEALRSGTSEHFSTFFVENSEIQSFWRWFAKRLDSYLAVLEADQADEISKITLEISKRLKKVFPFIQFPISISAYKNETFSIFISDFYTKSLSDGLEALLREMPENIKEKIHWIKIH
jgi:tetratricopeptide (TPR) repeat protein